MQKLPALLSIFLDRNYLFNTPRVAVYLYFLHIADVKELGNTSNNVGRERGFAPLIRFRVKFGKSGSTIYFNGTRPILTSTAVEAGGGSSKKEIQTPTLVIGQRKKNWRLQLSEDQRKLRALGSARH